MATVEIKVPGIGADEVETTEILVRVDDRAEAEQSPITVEGNEVFTEAPSPQAGIAKEIKVSVDDKTQIGVPTMIFDSVDGTVDAAPAQAEEEKETAPTAVPAAITARDVNVPDIGSDKVEVTEILMRVSDKAETRQSLITVEDDKTSIGVPTPFADTVKEIEADMGDKVSTGSLVMVSEVAGEAGTVVPAAKQEAAPAAAPVPAAGAKEVNAPDIGGSEVEVTEVMVKMGDRVAAEQLLITAEGDEASMEVPAPFTGIVKELKVNVGGKVKTGSLIMIFEVGGTASAVAPAKQEAAAPVPAVRAETPATAPAAKAKSKFEFTEDDAYIHATPLIRRLACEFGVNLAKMKGTGRRDRVLREDVQAYTKEAIKRTETVLAVTGDDIPGILPWSKVDFSKLGEIKEVELGRTQKISGTNLSRNWVMIPHTTHLDKTDITEPEAFRRQQNEEATKRKLDVKITSAVFIMKAVAATLEQTPRFGSSLPEDGQRLTLKKYINIGVAVDTPNGLAVPVSKDVSKKGIVELSRGPMAISKKVRGGKPTAGGMQSGCFAISSIGGLGTTHFALVVNASEVAILGISKSTVESVWNDKEFVPRLMLPISLSFGRRMIDGTDGVRFVTTIDNTLSDIHRLVMQVKEPAQRPAFSWQPHECIEVISEQTGRLPFVI